MIESPGVPAIGNSVSTPGWDSCGLFAAKYRYRAVHVDRHVVVLDDDHYVFVGRLVTAE